MVEETGVPNENYHLTLEVIGNFCTCPGRDLNPGIVERQLMNKANNHIIFEGKLTNML